MIGISYNYVVANLNFHELSCANEISRYFYVCFGGRGFPARVIMEQNN